MRIGLFIERFHPGRGGAEQWTFRFAQQVVARGHQVHVVAESFGPETSQLPIIAHPLGRIRDRLALAAAAAETLQRLDLDVIHDTGAGWYCDVFQPHGGSRRAAIGRNVLLAPRWLRPLKRRLIGWLPRYREFEALVERQYAAHDRLYLALSQRVADDFEHLHGIPASAIRIIPNGVDAERFHPGLAESWREPVRRRLGLDDEAVMVLIVAHNFRLKGVPALIAATRRLRDLRRAVHLVVAGGKRLAGWLRYAAACGVADRVHFTGAVSDPRPLYAAADVYAQPTFYDPCSLVVLEAMACSVPVVTTSINGASELMQSGREGFVLDDPEDVAALALRLEACCDPELRRRMGAAARQTALCHSFDRNVEEILGVYGEVAGRKRRAA